MWRIGRLPTLMVFAGMAFGCAASVPPGDGPIQVDTEAEIAQQGGMPDTLRATGNEPSWLLRVADGRLRFQRLGSDTVVDARLRVHRAWGSTTILRARDGGQRVTATIRQRLCRDSMSGMPHPDRVSVLVDDEWLHGCGGAPVDLLVAGNWVVEAIDGEHLAAERLPTLTFREEGRLFGTTGCNVYRTSMELTGEVLTIDQPAMTKRACAPAIMDTERAFLDALHAISRFDFDSESRLMLTDGNRARLIARPAP